MSLVYRPGHPHANENGMVEANIAGPRMKDAKRSPYLISDIQPFRSPIDQTWITSRAQVREHERKHGVRQVGNDIPPPE